MKKCIPSLEYQVIHKKLATRCQNNDSTKAFLMLRQELGCSLETSVLAQKLKMDLYLVPFKEFFVRSKRWTYPLNHFQ